MSDYILEMNDISKDFFGVYALKHVSFKVKKGEIHALCGENGAGKSTLMKILSGIYRHGDYSGTVMIRGKECKFSGVRDAEAAGIAIIYQELNLVSEMDIAENIYLNAWPTKFGVIDSSSMYYHASELCKELNIQAPLATKVKNVGVGVQQMVEIAKVLAKKVDILVLDEPTASLTEEEVDILFAFLNALRDKGVTCIYISHKLNEMFRISDRISVLRDGELIGTYPTDEVDEDFIIKQMVGREITERFPYREREIGGTVFKVTDYNVFDASGKQILYDINFELKRGEIVGIAGLMGAGRTELALSLFGAYGDKIIGDVCVYGEKAKISKPLDAIKKNIAMVTEDRKAQGLILTQSVSNNIVMASLDKLTRLGVIDSNKQHVCAAKHADQIRIKVPSLQSEVKSLSGGNQQKVVVAKWLMTEPKILFLDEPTRGIDVGAKYEIYTIMMDLAEQGYSILMISSDLPEVLGLSDRILVMHSGRISGELSRQEANPEEIMRYATGG
ncbi:MAG: ATP-binding cassette domain-containing protein [Clostridiales bacterium]|nr:ATP-binding cassette domain-containing protein [Clostridiales bacterium]